MGFLWCFKRLWFKSPSGRKRFNILGALNAVTLEVITVCNFDYINSWSVIELLFKLRKIKKKRTSLILDNASYQRSWLVQHLAKLMRIDLVFLPSYSPNLNLIERLWKFVRKQCCHSIPYETFEAFSEAIQHCVEQGHDLHKDELRSLLTWNFQTLKTPEKLAA